MHVHTAPHIQMHTYTQPVQVQKCKMRQTHVQELKQEAREIAQQLRELTVLTEDQVQFPALTW